MRTPVLAAVAISVALMAGGCSGSDAEPAARASTPAAAGAASGAAQQTEKPTDTALADDTEAICDQASRTSTGFGKTVAENLQLLKKSAAESKAAEAKAREKISRDMESFSFALLDMSKLASDAKVKQALATMGARVTALKGDISKVDGKTLTDLHGTLDSACGRG